MKHLKAPILVLFFLTSAMGLAQKSQKEINLEKNKVYIFTDEERANIQYQFYEKTQKLGMTDEVEAEYSRILIHHFYDMTRLDDKDQNNTEAEVKTKLEALVLKMNKEIEPLLTKEQYKGHLKNFNDVLKSAYRRNNWEWKGD